jgi:hypothetical protein
MIILNILRKLFLLPPGQEDHGARKPENFVKTGEFTARQMAILWRLAGFWTAA